jgi:hypothetical protein
MNEEDWLSLIEGHLRRYPAMAARDVYKLLFQGVLGPEHIMPSPEVFTARLKEELAILQPDSGEPLLESIRPDGALRRIYLRPWLAMGSVHGTADLSRLVEACLDAGKQSWGTSQGLGRIWYRFLDQVEEGRFPTISISEARALDNWLQEDNFPPAHHSTEYLSLYKPAYRLIGLFPGFDTRNGG